MLVSWGHLGTHIERMRTSQHVELLRHKKNHVHEHKTSCLEGALLSALF